MMDEIKIKEETEIKHLGLGSEKFISMLSRNIHIYVHIYI